MIKIGITGGIGSGKSVVSHLLQIMGIPVYISDDEAKRLTLTDSFIRKELIALLGEDVYKDGALNKSLLADYLFKAPENARVINSIIHPRVKDDFRSWADKQAGSKIVAIESAILIEAGFMEDVDKLIMVYAPIETRISRAIARDKSTREAVLRRIDNQMNDEEKKNIADYVVMNDDENPIIPQIENIINQLSSL